MVDDKQDRCELDCLIHSFQLTSAMVKLQIDELTALVCKSAIKAMFLPSVDFRKQLPAVKHSISKVMTKVNMIQEDLKDYIESHCAELIVKEEESSSRYAVTSPVCYHHSNNTHSSREFLQRDSFTRNNLSSDKDGESYRNDKTLETDWSFAASSNLKNYKNERASPVCQGSDSVSEEDYHTASEMNLNTVTQSAALDLMITSNGPSDENENSPVTNKHNITSVNEAYPKGQSKSFEETLLYEDKIAGEKDSSFEKKSDKCANIREMQNEDADFATNDFCDLDHEIISCQDYKIEKTKDDMKTDQIDMKHQEESWIFPEKSYEELPTKKLIGVYVSHFSKPDAIWIQMPGCGVEDLQQKLNLATDEESTSVPNGGRKDDIVAALYAEDEQYYRAVVLKESTSEQDVEVLYVDYGNTEIVKRSSLRSLSSGLKRIPGLAVCCSIVQIDGELLGSLSEKVANSVWEMIKDHMHRGLHIKVVLSERKQLKDDDQNHRIPLEPRYDVCLYTRTDSFDDSVQTTASTTASDTVHVSNSDCSSLDSFEIPLEAIPNVQLETSKLSLGDTHYVMLNHVRNPSCFYLHFVNSETATLDRFHEVMDDYYKEDNEPLIVKQLPIGSSWASRWADGHWYRCRIIANITSTQDESIHEDKVRVLAVDFGDEEVVSIRDIRMLHDDFCIMPCLAIPCCLAKIFPLDGWQENLWTADAVKGFIDMCGGLGAVLKATFMSFSMGDTYEVMLETGDGQLINKLLVDKGLASSKYFIETTFPDKKLDNKESTEGQNGRDKETDWNPMEDAYFSVHNTLQHDDECAETILMGCRNTDESRLCKFFRAGRKCYRGDACQWEHSLSREGVTTAKERVFLFNNEHQQLPREDSFVAAVVTLIDNPVKFYVYLPYGIHCLRESNSLVSNDSLRFEELAAAMQDYYKLSLPYHSSSLPTIGELKVLCRPKKSGMKISRVCIKDMKEMDYGYTFKVFCIDSGDVLWVREDQLRHIAPQFVHMPPLTVECWLEDVKEPLDGWNRTAVDYFRELTMDYTVVALIRHVDRDNHRLGVVLYNTDGAEDVNVNEALMEYITR